MTADSSRFQPLPSRLLFLVVAGLWALLSNAQVASAASVDDPASAAQRVVSLTNQERSGAGVVPLKWNDTLAACAAGYARDMAERNYFSHTSPEGTNPAVRARAAGYSAYEGDQMFVGENLAKNYFTPEAAVGGWMASPGHRDNMLNRDFREIGVSVVMGPNGTSYWVTLFGSSPEEPSRELLSAIAPTSLEDTGDAIDLSSEPAAGDEVALFDEESAQ